MPNFVGPVDFNWIETLKLRLQNLATAPSSPQPGWTYFNTVTDTIEIRNGANNAWISLGGGGSLDTEAVQDIVGAMLSGNTESGISATYQDGDGTIDLAVDFDPVKRLLGTTLGISTFDDPDVTLDFDTPWGIDDVTGAYFDAAGAAAGEEAVLMVNPDGTLAIVKPGTTISSDWNTSPADVLAALVAHIDDPSDAHDASAISFSPAGTIASANVQAALEELDTQKTTAAAVATQITTAIDALVGTAPGTLDTFGEISDALNDDANIAATLTALINAKPSKYAASIGNASATSFNVDHNLGSLDCIVQVFQNSDGAQVEPDVVHSTTNRVIVSFTSAPSSNQFRVVVIG